MNVQFVSCDRTAFPVGTSNGGGLATELISWNLNGMSHEDGVVTALINFANANVHSKLKYNNSGEGQRIVAGMVPMNNNYDFFGLFDTAGMQNPNQYGVWYGFYTAPGVVSGYRVGEVDVYVTTAFEPNAELRVEVWADSVRYFMGATELYRSAAPATPPHLYAGLCISTQGNTWRDGRAGAQLSSLR